jgi:hypothetical protein
MGGVCSMLIGSRRMRSSSSNTISLTPILRSILRSIRHSPSRITILSISLLTAAASWHSSRENCIKPSQIHVCSSLWINLTWEDHADFFFLCGEVVVDAEWPLGWLDNSYYWFPLIFNFKCTTFYTRSFSFLLVVMVNAYTKFLLGVSVSVSLSVSVGVYVWAVSFFLFFLSFLFPSKRSQKNEKHYPHMFSVAHM